MLSFIPGIPADRPTRILLLGAHADDIELGCGTTIMHLLRTLPAVQVTWVVLSGSDARQREAAESAHRYLGEESSHVVLLRGFADSRFPFDAPAIKDFFSKELQPFNPDLVFTHFRDDRHQDHRVVSDLTWQTFRDNQILEYEVLKYDGDVGSPNCFVEALEQDVATKCDRLLDCFASQRGKQWFDAEAVRAIMRIRGVECAAASRYAEAFYVRKLKLS